MYKIDEVINDAQNEIKYHKCRIRELENFILLLQKDLLNLYEFTPMERIIYFKVKEGLNNKEISDELGISYCTVKKHVSNILQKTNSRDKIQLILFK